MNTTDDGLLPCPRCGGSAVMSGKQWHLTPFVECNTCTVRVLAQTRKEAIAAWNTRTTPSLVTDDEVERATDAIIAALGTQAGMLFSQRNANIAARAALAASDRDVLVEALEWIEAFAQIRSKDDSKVFARVNRGALRTIAERAGAALIPFSRRAP